MATISTSEKVPKQMQDTFNAIVALTDTVCTAHLDQECALRGVASFFTVSFVERLGNRRADSCVASCVS